MARVFISFLGIGKYERVNFQLKGTSTLTRFVSHAILNAIARDWQASKEDRAIFLVTDRAYQQNWEGLQATLAQAHYGFEITHRMIDEGNPMNSFSLVYELIRPGDTIYFDITHAFRYFPMFVMVLINYAKSLRNVKVGGIYYGLYQHELQQLPEHERHTEIMDLSILSFLQDLTSDIHAFITTGRIRLLRDEVYNQIRPFLGKSSDPHTQLARHLRYLFDRTRELVNHIMICNGPALMQNEEGPLIHKNIQSIRDLLSQIDKQDPIYSSLVPIIPLIDKLEDKLRGFIDTQGHASLWASIQYTIEHHLIQQGITLLLEGLVHAVCLEYGHSLNICKNHRAPIAQAARSVTTYIIPHEQENRPDDWEVTDQVRGSIQEMLRTSRIIPILRNHRNILHELRSRRNWINHAGHQNDRNIPDIGLLKEAYNAFRNIPSLVQKYGNG